MLKEYYFNSWQNETVFTRKYGDISIKALLTEFIFKSLFPFINKNGYIFSISTNLIGHIIATDLYHLDYNKYYMCSLPKDINFNDEHYLYFQRIIDWHNFWKSWNYQTNNFFDGAEIEIQNIIWAYIHLEKSTAYNEYMKEFEESDSEDEMTKKLNKIDPYILDQMNKYQTFKNTRKED